MATAILTSKGQMTIPKEVRERLGLTAGDRLEFRFDEGGRVILVPLTEPPLGRVPGMLRHLAPEQPVSVETMRQALRRRAGAKHGR